MASQSPSLLEKITGRMAVTEHSWTRQESAPQHLSLESNYSPQLPPCAQDLVLKDSEEGDSPKQLSQESCRVKWPESRCTLTNNRSSFVEDKLRPCVVVTDSSDEEFEKFLSQLKTPKTLPNKVLEKHRNSLQKFIVESDDDDFDSVFSKSGRTSKTKNGIKMSNAGSERSQRNTALLRCESPVLISDSDDDSIVIKRKWQDRQRPTPGVKTDRGLKQKSVRTNCKENAPKTDCLAIEEWAPGDQNKFFTPQSSDEEFECLMDRIKNRTKTQTPGSPASKIKPKTATTDPAKVPCFDLINIKARKPRSQTDVHSSPYFPKDNVLKKPAFYVERTSEETMRRLCNVEGCFLQDLSCSTSIYVKSFKLKKHELAIQLYSLYNQTIFEQKLPEHLEITWNKKMRKTAGYCVTGQKQRTLDRYARIELSEKVCDSADRLRDTLIHEICHAATWLINGVRDGHGQYWKFYARKATVMHPELPMVSRCHSYEINYKFTYECSRCKNTIGRHSKSLDTERFVCALCKGKLVLQTTTRKDGNPSLNLLTPFAKFVKENYGSAKKEMAGMSHAEVMRKLSADFSTKTKISN